MLFGVAKGLVADCGARCRALRRAVLGDSASQRLDLRRLAGVLGALLSLAAAGTLAPAGGSHPAPHWIHPLNRSSVKATPVAYTTTMVVEQVKRKVYPYSIVPGGAEDLRQARQAMNDPAVRAHYSNIDFAQLHQVKLGVNLSGYVSYRWGDKIYWTSKKVTLRAGETVFTDGTHVVRGRCLNCYSALPMFPTRPNEPTELALDSPVEMPVTVYSFPKLPVLAPVLPVPPGELTPTVPVIPAVLPIGSGGGGGGGGFWFPLIPIIPPIHHHPGGPGSPTSPGVPIPPPVIPPVAVVPEPRYGWLVLAGLFALGLTFRRMRARQSD